MAHKKQQQKQMCNYCGKYTRELKRHERLHTGKDIFQCNICKKIYLHLSSLTVHQNFHLNVFACSICKTAYAQERHLKAHNLSAHSRNSANSSNQLATFSCKDCDITFEKSVFLKTHMKQVHSFGELNLMKETFAHQTPLGNNHTALNEHNKSIKAKQPPAEHSTNKKERKHVCPICQTAFSRMDKLKNHATTHLDNPNIHCKLCNARFQSHQALAYHKKQVHGTRAGSPHRLKYPGFENKDVHTESPIIKEDHHCQSKSAIYIRQSLSEDPNLWPKVLLSRSLNDVLVLHK